MDTIHNKTFGICWLIVCFLLGSQLLSAQACPQGSTRSGPGVCGCQTAISQGSALTPVEVAQLAYQARFRCDGLVNAIAVASAESGDDPGLIDANKNSAGQVCIKNTSYDVGLWQINVGIWGPGQFQPPFPADGLPPTAPTAADQATWLYNNMNSPQGLKWANPNNGGGFWAFGNKNYCASLNNPDPLANACSLAALEDPNFGTCGSQLCTLGPLPSSPPIPPTLGWTGTGACPAPPPPCISLGTVGFGKSPCLPVVTVASFDPNTKFGVVGAGAPGWIPSQPVSYSVNFSNESTATAPAQTVTITDTLKSTLLDLSTLSLGPITFGSTLITPNSALLAAVGSYSTALDLRPATNLIVSITAALNSETGLLAWTFISIDPATGQPTTDPLAGFLPPGTSGSVSFTVSPQSLPTGTQITNAATVIFDANAPINTPTWINTVDNAAPVSRVAALPATEPATGFTVTWSGTDVGSGVQGFTIFASDNGGPFAPWLTDVATTSATFTGQLGHTYAFYSIAQDLVGNTEAAKTSAEATTLVSSNVDSTPPVTTATVSPNPNAAGWNNSNVTVALNATDNVGGSGVKEIHYTMTGAQTGGNVFSGSSANLIVSTDGITTVTYFSVDNAGNFEAAHSITIMLDKTPPTILGSRTPAANVNGWNNTPVTVSFQCADTLSGLAAGSPPAPVIVTAQGAGQSVNGSCSDVAGNSASASVQEINIDTTPPILTVTVNPPPNANGWNNSPTMVSFAAVDSLSGVALVSAPVTVSIDGEGQTVTGSATDLAGNLTSGSVTINLDQAPPEAYIQFDPTNKDIAVYGRDSLSGVAPGPVMPISVKRAWGKDGDIDRDDGHKDDDQRVDIRTYQIIDLAGNSLVLVTEVRKHEQSEAVRLLSAQYDGGAVVNLPRNETSVEWNFDRDGTLRELHQALSESAGKDSQKWNAEYESRRGTTTIERESPKPEQKSIQQGLALLQIATTKGNLTIGF